MARHFIFRFETMLRIRQQREDEHKRIVGNRLREISQVKERMALIDQQIQAELRTIRISQEPGTIDMLHVTRHRHWLGCLHKAVLDHQARLRFLEAQLAQERAMLAEAAKQRRILQKLKERQWQSFAKEQNRIETGMADDLVTVRYVFENQANA